MNGGKRRVYDNRFISFSISDYISNWLSRHESDRSNMIVPLLFGIFGLLFAFYFLAYAMADTQDIKNKFTKYVGINFLRGVKDDMEEIYG